MTRTTAEVFDDHLRRRAEGRLEEDLQQDYSDNVILLCEFGVMCGREAVRQSAVRLGLQLPNGKFEYLARHVQDEYAFLKWRADSDTFRVEHGADSFVIRDGRIVMQSVYYQLYPKEPGPAG